jgi:predicted RNA-binding protein with RPS1 domain
LGGVDGMVHVSAISRRRINHPSEVLKKGDTVKAVIKEINEYRAEENLGKTQMESDAASSDQKDPKMEEMEDYKNEILTKLVDGTEARILSKGDAMSVGDKVEVKDAEGNFMKAPAGEHKLEGGLVIYVDELGFINELETAETEESDEMKSMFEAISQLTILVGELKKTISNVSKENSELTEKFNKFSKEPSVESVTKKQATLSKSADKLERAKFFGGR